MFSISTTADVHFKHDRENNALHCRKSSGKPVGRPLHMSAPNCIGVRGLFNPTTSMQRAKRTLKPKNRKIIH